MNYGLQQILVLIGVAACAWFFVQYAGPMLSALIVRMVPPQIREQIKWRYIKFKIAMRSK